MKKIFAIAAAMLLTITSFAQNGRAIYNKYSESKGVSAVYISSAMFRMMGRIPDMEMGTEDVNLTPIIKSLTGFYLLNSENEEINGLMRQDVEKYVDKGDYELLMEIKDDGEVVHLYTVGRGNEITSIVFLAYEESECTFICMDGKMDRDQLENILAGQMQ